MPVQNSSFSTPLPQQAATEAQSPTQRITSGSSARGRRTRSSLSRSEEQPWWRGEPILALFTSTCGQRTCRAAQAPSRPFPGAQQLGRPGCRTPPFSRQPGEDRLPPGSALALSPPGQDYSARRALRAAHTPPPLSATAAVPARPGAGSPDGGCARRAGQGVLRAVATLGGGVGLELGGPAPSRAGERLLAASLPRPGRPCGRGS